MTPVRRDLMLMVTDGTAGVLPYMHFFDQFYRCDDMLRWLIRQRLVGKEFMAWAAFRIGRSMLDVAKYVLAEMDREDVKPVIFGRDVRC